jgi:hypothetical protein
MTIFNLKVKDFNGFIKFKKVYAFNGCSIPILGVYDVVRCKVSSIYPTSALDLERMCFSTLDDLSVNIKLNKPIYLVNRSRDDLLFSQQ